MTRRSVKHWGSALMIVLCALALWASADGAWLSNVPPRDHERVNPYGHQTDAIAAGRRIFVDHCAHCHGETAEGTKKRPSLKSDRVQQQASDGDLHWLLVNGNRGRGMPSWVKLSDPQIWQVISYVKSLH
jgi:mono/diheme cytochrome c family protein